MESFKITLSEITEHFNAKMTEFQKELKGAIPATSPTSNLNAQFGAFRVFVLSALENLQLQVELLARQQDELEMRSRKKILLIHGVTEADKEDTRTSVAKLLSERLRLPQISQESISRCHRLGRAGGEKPRAVLIKFNELALRNKVWSAKTNLKGTGVTLSEFLISSRHKTFLAARQRFGVANCWTRDGNIMVIDATGKRHRIITLSDLNAIQSSGQEGPGPVIMPAAAVGAAAATVMAPKDSRIGNPRIKRVVKK